MNDNVKGWLINSKEDMESAELLLKGGIYGSSCYHTQQSAEKYLKAILCCYNPVVPFSHDLEKLAENLKSYGVSITNEAYDACLKLTIYSTLTRYPGYRATKDDAQKAVREARIVERFALDYFEAIN